MLLVEQRGAIFKQFWGAEQRLCSGPPHSSTIQRDYPTIQYPNSSRAQTGGARGSSAQRPADRLKNFIAEIKGKGSASARLYCVDLQPTPSSSAWLERVLLIVVVGARYYRRRWSDRSTVLVRSSLVQLFELFFEISEEPFELCLVRASVVKSAGVFDPALNLSDDVRA